MDFEFSEEQRAFAKEVEAFLDANDDPDVFDVTRENMAQIVDTPKRREFMAKLGEKGWLGITWPTEYDGQDGEGVYEYILNEALAGRGGPQIGKGVGIIGKTLIHHGSDELKQEFLPKILRNEVEFAVGYSEPDAGSDAASMKLKAERDGQRTGGGSMARRCGPPRPTSPSGTGSAPAPTRTTSTRASRCSWSPWTTPASRCGGCGPWATSAPTRCSSRTCGSATTTWSARSTRASSTSARRSTSSASRCSPTPPSSSASTCWSSTCASAERDGEKLADDPVVRQRLAQLITDAEVARVLGLRVVHASMQGGAPPTSEASEYKLYATEFSKRLADAAMDIAGPGSQLRVRTEDAPMAGRSESTYRYTVLDTIGGGTSEVQKNIIARRRLGLPKNF